MPIQAITAINEEKEIYKDLTHQLNNYNEIYNLNSYLQKQGSLEFNRLSSTNNTLKGKIMNEKQEYLLNDYKINYYEMKNVIMTITLITVALSMIVTGFLLKEFITIKTASIIVTVFLVIQILLLIFIVKYNSSRRNLLWNQYYWNKF